MPAREVDFTEKFYPQDNPFKISIAKIQPPKTLEGNAPVDAVLIKLKCLVTMLLAADSDRDLFQRFTRALERKKSFCGVFTPEMSEPYYDSEEASVELTSYLRRGMEEKILHLDTVARASHEKRPAVPPVGAGAGAAEDDLLVDQFMAQLRQGNNLSDAVFKAAKETKELISRGRKAESEVESEHLPAPRMETGKVKIHKPPPGPSLGKPAPSGPALQEVPRAEQLPPPNEVFEALQLVSKEGDAELDSQTDMEMEIKIQKDDEKKKRETSSSQP